ncbi:MAG: hypothetical protein J5656_02105 [Clostridia bacterium]|nr:hypothetical protein [Clostridia bacterium]
MFIISQDEKNAVNLDNVLRLYINDSFESVRSKEHGTCNVKFSIIYASLTIAFDDRFNEPIEGGDVMLGKYKTEEIAKDILKDILANSVNSTYIMPKDE